MRHGLRTQLSAGFTLIVLITISLISLSSNLLINRQFEKYARTRQQSFSEDLADSLSLQYDSSSDSWNLEYIHGVGMYALNDGYIIKLYDREGNCIWDAEDHDMTYCHQIMDGISRRMDEARPNLNGNFIAHRYELVRDRTVVGHVDISYYGPYSFTENDFHFLDALNRILLAIAVLSVAGAILAGAFLAGHISRPIIKTIQITKEISEGNYSMRFESDVRTKEFNELTRAVNQMAGSLEAQENMRRRLTTDVAHELRTPLSNVSSHLEAMIEGVWEPTPERLQGCYDEIARISRLVSDLERLRQAENEDLELQKTPTDLLQLARTVRSEFGAKLEQKHLTCTVDGRTVLVPADPNRLHQVLSNLLSNSVKYTHENGHIRITVSDGNGQGIVRVEDDGIGIPQEDLPFVFERFYRTDRSRSRRTGGAGIGLTIARSIVHAHGGRITAESSEGQGSCFTVSLPK